jgi:beta-lactamase regulating signal transducer with metallopeptidase domain
MTIPYALRLICVSLAAFAIIFTIIGAIVSAAAAAAQGLAGRMRANAAAQFILLLRLLPAALAAFLVAVVCVPSYIRFEQRVELEEAGPLCIALALFSCGLFGVSLIRTFRAWRNSVSPDSTLALVGILRPRIIVSDTARNALSSAELSMALSHEQSHAESRDNFKRLLILLAPGPFPKFAALEETWKILAEYAADDQAAAGDPSRSLSLAAALVRIAKLGTTAEPPLVTSFLAAGNSLESRVDRLLNPSDLPANPYPRAVAISSALLVAGFVAAVLQPGTPARVHWLLEMLIH